MKSVMISIQPKWCAKIASGEKTVEVRKTKPKIETPFRCYIYETQGETEVPWMDEDGHMIFRGRGMVIGEFVCDKIYFFRPKVIPCDHYIKMASCVSLQELIEYANTKNEHIYGWHISDLVIYEKPKELSEFYAFKKCNSCKVSGYESSACIYDEDCKVPAIITRPPQSWCYVEE